MELVLSQQNRTNSQVDLVIKGRGLFVQTVLRVPESWPMAKKCKEHFSDNLLQENCAVYRVTLQQRDTHLYREVMACVQLSSDEFFLGNDRYCVGFSFLEAPAGGGGMLVIQSVAAHSRSGNRPANFKWAEVVTPTGGHAGMTFLYQLYV